jgi:hypothetical protein
VEANETIFVVGFKQKEKNGRNQGDVGESARDIFGKAADLGLG